MLPAIERLIYFSKLPGKLLRPPAAAAVRQELLQISRQDAKVTQRPSDNGV